MGDRRHFIMVRNFSRVCSMLQEGGCESFFGSVGGLLVVFTQNHLSQRWD